MPLEDTETFFIFVFCVFHNNVSLLTNCLECDCVLTLVSFSVGNVYFWKVVKLPGLLNKVNQNCIIFYRK